MTDRRPVRLHSSLRSRRPAATLAVAEALMPALGISRIADITRMDRLGLPVFVSVRPRGRTLRVHAGKGVDPVEARVGALMEAIEFAAAEPDTSRWERVPLRVGEIAAQLGDGLRLADFAPRLGAQVRSGAAIPTVACEDLVAGRVVMLPAELVFIPFEADGGAPLFGATSNGLASGNTLAEATLHGLLEVLERDALAMSRPRDLSRFVDTHELPEPFATLADGWRAAGIELAVRHVPNGLALPCFEAFVHEPDSPDVVLAGGSGLHPDREVALARAVCEAAQSRLSHVHGGRDDVTTFFAAGGPRRRQALAALREAQRRRCFDRRRRARYAELPHEPAGDRPLTHTLERLLEHLAAAGFGSVLRHRFAVELDGLHVVKVVVPRCEDVESAPSRIGPRLWAALAGDG